jgi:hypothetical protein
MKQSKSRSFNETVKITVLFDCHGTSRVTLFHGLLKSAQFLCDILSSFHLCSINFIDNPLIVVFQGREEADEPSRMSNCEQDMEQCAGTILAILQLGDLAMLIVRYYLIGEQLINHVTFWFEAAGNTSIALPDLIAERFVEIFCMDWILCRH